MLHTVRAFGNPPRSPHVRNHRRQQLPREGPQVVRVANELQDLAQRLFGRSSRPRGLLLLSRRKHCKLRLSGAGRTEGFLNRQVMTASIRPLAGTASRHVAAELVEGSSIRKARMEYSKRESLATFGVGASSRRNGQQDFKRAYLQAGIISLCLMSGIVMLWHTERQRTRTAVHLHPAAESNADGASFSMKTNSRTE